MEGRWRPSDLDMSQTHPDALGFKYARLSHPILLEASSKPVVIYPRGLLPFETYDVRASASSLHLQQTGSQLMAKGITLETVAAGELIFLNLPHYPGSGTDHVAPTAPAAVTKRLGTNLGVEGIELSWSPSHDDNWLSYYEIRKNGKLIGRAAKGTFFFDHSDFARNDIDARFRNRCGGWRWQSQFGKQPHRRQRGEPLVLRSPRRFFSVSIPHTLQINGCL
jgi:hypothetical protein